MKDDDLAAYLIGLIIVAVVMGLVGYALGKTRGLDSVGFWLGLALGPIGWIIVLLLPETGRRCPECQGVVPPAARRCRHCGVELVLPLKSSFQPPPSPLTFYYVLLDDKPSGPLTVSQIKSLLPSGRLTAEHLCARSGDAQWRRIGEIV